MPVSDEPNTASLVAAGSLCLAAGSLYGWSGLSLALTDKFNLGATQVGEVFSVAILAFTGAILLSARLPLRLRGLLAASAAGCLGACATLLAAMAPSYSVFLMCYGLGFGAASGTIYTASLEMASESSSSWATPAMVALFGLGGAVFGAGTRALVTEGLGLWSIWPVTLALAFASAFGLVMHWQTPNPARGGVLHATTLSAPISLAAVQIAGLWLLFALGAMAGLMCLALALTILADHSSGPGLASFAVFAIAIANTTGRLSVAWLQRALAAPLIVALGNTFCVIALTGLILCAGAPLALGFLAILAAGYGVIASAMPLFTRSMLRPGEFGRVFPVVLTGWGAAGFLAPRLSGQIRDMTGDFDLALKLCLATSVAAACASLLYASRLSRSAR